MKKTIHINIAGHAFGIDEDAYDELNSYLEEVKAKLGDTDEAKETLEDINLRIAELFRGVHPDASSSVTLEDVKEVIKTLGDPGDYETPDDPDKATESKTRETPYVKKQLFRDPDNRVLGGVCSGLGNYFGTDPLLFRLLFILATFLYGTSVLVYLILWIAIPKAVTMQQRIMMTGGAPGSESWRRRRMSRSGNADVMNGVLRVIAVVAGILLIIISFLSLSGIIMAFSLTDVILESLTIEGVWTPGLENFFLLPGQKITAVIGILLAAGIPLLVLFYLGMHLIFRFKKGGPAFLITSLILWLAGLGLITYTVVQIASGYANEMEIEERQLLDIPETDTIYIEPTETSLKLGEGTPLFSNNGYSVKILNNQPIIVGTPDIEVNHDALNFEISVRKKSRGKSSDEAIENAEMIEYFYLQNDSLLLLDRYFSIQKPGIMRGQKTHVTIQIPEDKAVKIADEFKYLIDAD
jgi:phage shock protein PspC (stress-responsive transcriptional regulator)